MQWIRDDDPLRTARLLVQAGHYERAFDRMPPECRSNPSEIGAFLGIPMSEAEQVFAARIPRKIYQNESRPRESATILTQVHQLLRRYDRRIVTKFEVEKLRKLLDRPFRAPWKYGPDMRHISAKVSSEVFELLDIADGHGSRSARIRWAILESWAKGSLPPKGQWRNLRRDRVVCLNTNPSMYNDLMREAKRFRVAIGAVIEEHCYRALG